MTLKIENVSVEWLTFDPRNARKHSDNNLAAIAESLKQFGQRKPIVVTHDNVVVAGNGTLEAAKMVGLKDLAVVRCPKDWSDEQVMAFALADNRSAELAEWNPEVLSEQMLELEQAGFDIEALGFEPVKIEKEKLDVDEEDVEPPTDPVSKLGDVWLLGEHRVICADSTVDKTYETLMNGNRATMMFTDPPWNVAIGLDSNPRHRQRKGLQNDNLSAEDFSLFLENFAKSAIKHIEGDAYCVLGASEWPTLDTSLRKAGFHWSATIIWVKDIFVLGRSKYHRRYEPIWYGWRKDGKSSFQGRRDLDDVWEIPRPRRSEEHPTMKPIALMETAIENSSKSGDIVLDPFGGSGATLLAAESVGRVCYTVELEPGYVDVICKRYQEATGQMPILEKTGKEHDFLVEE